MSEVKRPKRVGQFIEPVALLGLVENTAPFLFEQRAHASDQGFVKRLQDYKLHPPQALDLWDYFDLCLCAHFATVGSFVPTDVDLAIRLKLWASVHHAHAHQGIWEHILAFQEWDESLVSKRFVITPTGRKLSGHQGEWFTIAMGAYGSALKVAPEQLIHVREAIEREFKNQEEALTELLGFFRQNPDLSSMKKLFAGIAAVAHNLGDLDRMFDAWEIPDTDVLKRRVYRSGHEDARAPKEVFLLAGKIYQELLASENHRNFALREPKCLRRSPDLLLPFGPFLDEWGKSLVDEAEISVLTTGEQREVAEALIHGWKKLNPRGIYTSQGYARVLAGMMVGLGGSSKSGLVEGRERLGNLLPPVLRKEFEEGGLRTLTAISREEFEKKLLVKLGRLLSI